MHYKKNAIGLIFIIAIVTIIFLQLFSKKDLIRDSSYQESVWETVIDDSFAQNEVCNPGKMPNEISWGNMLKNFNGLTGIGGGFSSQDFSDAVLLGFNTYKLPPNAANDVIFHVIYMDSQPSKVTVRYMILLDEKQLSGAIGDVGQSYLDVDLFSKKEASIKIKLPPLEAGIHDLIILGILAPQNEPVPEGLIQILPQRVTIVAGDNPSLMPRDFSLLSAPENSAPSAPFTIGPTLTFDLKTLKVWNWPETRLKVKENANVDFYVLVGYDYVVNQDISVNVPLPTAQFAVLSFYDYAQFDMFESRHTFYGEVSKDTAYSALKASITADGTGRHDIFILRIANPGIPMCWLQGDFSNGQLYPSNVLASRVALDVLP